MSKLQLFRPGVLGGTVFNDLLDDFFGLNFDRALSSSTQGYPVCDVYNDEDGGTVMEFALAGFSRDELSVDVVPEKRSITVAAEALTKSDGTSRRISRRSFRKTFVNYDNKLDLTNVQASFTDGLLRITVPKHVVQEDASMSIEIA